jgi:formate--tetrahydrofolate ligase
MTAPTDLEIARHAELLPITRVATEVRIEERFLKHYGDHIAKVKLEAIAEAADRPMAKYVAVTAITPTPLGEGKTTMTVGLGQGMRYIGKHATVSLRQPSMGPTFGI